VTAARQQVVRALGTKLTPLATGHRPDDRKWLAAVHDRVGEQGIWRRMGQVLPAGKEPEERPALLRHVVADRPAQHRVGVFERVESRALRHRARNMDVDLVPHPGQGPQVVRERDSDDA